jgi:hypothetical protein
MVAGWLKIYRIPCVVLNACESARADAGEQANMARAFLDGGVGNVLAMTFKVSSGAIDLFLRTFYLDLFVAGSSFAQAARSARAGLKTQPLRDARFRRQRELVDWFIPVIYSTGSDFSVVPGSRGAENRPVPVAEGSEYDEVVVGRDFDLLRIERKLLQKKRIFLTAPPGYGKTAFLKWACKIWEATNFRESVLYADLSLETLREPTGLLKFFMDQLPALEEDDDLSDELRDIVMNVLDVPIGQKENALAVFKRLHHRPTILALDGLHTFCLKEHEGLPAIFELIEYLCKYCNDLLVVCVQRDIDSLPVDIGNIHEDFYELPALDMSDSVELYGFALKPDDGSAKVDGTDLEYLFRFSKLVKGIPGAVAILEETREHGWTLEHLMTNIYTHTRNVNAALSRLLLREAGLFAELNALASELTADELAVLIALGMYWDEGPYLKSFTHKLTETFICADQAAIIRVLNLLSKQRYLTVDRKSPARICWIHPLLTVFSRAKAHVLKATGRCIEATELALAVFDHVGDASDSPMLKYFDRRWFLNDIDQQSVFARGLNAEEKVDHERSLQNTTTALLLCGEVEGFPVKDWPAEHFMHFTMHLAGTAHSVETAYLTSKYDTLVSRLQDDVIASTSDPEPRTIRILLAFLVFLILARNFTAKADPGSKTLEHYGTHFDSIATLYKTVCGEDLTLLQAKIQIYMVAKRWDDCEETLLALEALGNYGAPTPAADELRSSIHGALDKDGQFGGSAASTDRIRQKLIAQTKTTLSPEEMSMMKMAVQGARMFHEAKNDPIGRAAVPQLQSKVFMALIGTMKGKPRLFGDKSSYMMAQMLTDESNAQEMIDRMREPAFRLKQLENAADTMNWPEAHQMHLNMEVESFYEGNWMEAAEHHKAALESLGNRTIDGRKVLESSGQVLETAVDLLDFEKFSENKTAEGIKDKYRAALRDYDKHAASIGISEEEQKVVRFGLQNQIDTLEKEPELAERLFDAEQRTVAEADLKKILPYVLSPEGRSEGGKDSMRCSALSAIMRGDPFSDEAIKAAFEIEELAKTSRVARFIFPMHVGVGNRMKVCQDAQRVGNGSEAMKNKEDVFKNLAVIADLQAGLERLGDSEDDVELYRFRPFANNGEAVCTYALAQMQVLENDLVSAIDSYDRLLTKYADGTFDNIKSIAWDFQIATAVNEQLRAKAVLAARERRWRDAKRFCNQYIEKGGMGLQEHLIQMQQLSAAAAANAHN